MMKYSVYTWDLVQALDSVSPASCKTLVTFIDSIAQTTNQKRKEPRNAIQVPTNHIILPCPTYTEPRAKRDRLGIQT